MFFTNPLFFSRNPLCALRWVLLIGYIRIPFVAFLAVVPWFC